jgi:hypothetical protein
MALGNKAKSATTGFTMVDQVRVDHCLFYNGGGGDVGSYIWIYCTFYGVVDNCQFGTAASYQPYGGYALFGMAWQGDNNPNWYNGSPQNIYTLGSEKFIYFEDNIFYLNPDGSVRVIAQQYGPRAAFRYNTIYNGCWDGVWELHGHQADMASTFGNELYGNLITGGNGALMKTRGGKSLVFYNTITGAIPLSTGYWGNIVCQTIAPAEQMIHDNYLWNNRAGYTGSTGRLTITSSSGPCNGLSNIPSAGRDMFNENTTTPGVTYGALANRPVLCTMGQAYWATNQSTSDLTNYVGDINTYGSRETISGTLYKCTGTNTWTAFYTPYTYPHPLRGGEKTIKPPANVKILGN